MQKLKILNLEPKMKIKKFIEIVKILKFETENT